MVDEEFFSEKVFEPGRLIDLCGCYSLLKPGAGAYVVRCSKHGGPSEVVLLVEQEGERQN